MSRYGQCYSHGLLKKSPKLTITNFRNIHSLPFPEERGSLWHLQASFYMGLVGGWGRAMLALNDLKVYNRQVLLHHIYKRKQNTPFLTVCNHTSMLDDPALVSAILDWKTLLNAKYMRWSLAAKEICFSNRFFSYVSSHGKVIPVVRGDGIYQAGINYAMKQLNDGKWVHIFPEGKITLDPCRLKWGVGRLIAECRQMPIVLPFYHVGMENFLPTKKPYFPRIGKKITVLIGEPIDLQNIWHQVDNKKCSATDLRLQLTEIIQDSLTELKLEAEKLHEARLKIS